MFRYFSNTTTESKTLGEVELKYVSVGDLEFFVELLDKVEDDREFVLQVLYHQLITPEVSFAEFSKTPDDELIKVARDLVRHEEHTFQYFKETTDAELFANFREAIETYHQKQVEQLQAILEPMIESSERIFESFGRQYADIIQQALEPTSYIAELMKEVSRIGEKFRESHLRFAESLRPAIEYQLTARIVSEALMPQMNFWQNWVEQNKAAMFDSYARFWQTFQEQYEVAEEEAIEILRKHKWFMTLSLPLGFVFEAVRIGRRKGNQRKAMNRLFADYFSSHDFENLENLVDGWKTNAIFEPRMKIFKDCVLVMGNAKSRYNPSNVVLPTLIAQIDGIQMEFMEKKGLSFDLKKRKWRNKDGKVVCQTAWFKSQTSNQKLLDLANDVFLNILFQGAQRGQPLGIPFTFSRHKIMHGEYLRYGRIDNTIRAFLILDFLATLSK